MAYTDKFLEELRKRQKQIDAKQVSSPYAGQGTRATSGSKLSSDDAFTSNFLVELEKAQQEEAKRTSIQQSWANKQKDKQKKKEEEEEDVAPLPYSSSSAAERRSIQKEWAKGQKEDKAKQEEKQEEEEKGGGFEFFKDSSALDPDTPMILQPFNFANALLQTGADVVGSAAQGFGNSLEGISDFILHGGAYVADALGADKAADFLHGSANHNSVNNLFDNYIIGENTREQSFLGSTLRSVAQGVGQAGSLLATSAVGQALNWGKTAVTALSTATMFSSAAGSGISEAYQHGEAVESAIRDGMETLDKLYKDGQISEETYNTAKAGYDEILEKNKVTDAEAFNYGMMKGTIEAGTELLAGGLGKSVEAIGVSRGIGGIDDIFAHKLFGKVSNYWVRSLGEAGIKALGEGAEEVLAGLGTAVAKKLTYLSDEDLGKLIEDENLLEAFVVGTMTSAAMQGGDVVTNSKNATDLVTGLNKNEDAVVQKEYENRLKEASKDSKKISGKDKAKIYDEVMEDLEKGRISVDTIEEVLGGEDYKAFEEGVRGFTDSETYKSYTEALKEEKAIRDEFDITLEGTDRYNELKSRLEGTPRSTELRAQLEPEVQRINDLKRKLRESVSSKVGSKRLAESYLELQRSQQKYQGDVTKYKSEAARKTIQNLIDGGIANNSNEFHEFADLLASISEDKGVVFDITDNKRLKGTRFEVKGATVNAFITDDGYIAINNDSKRKLNTLVGHEITHVLEGTEFYKELQRAVREYAKTKGEWDSRLRDTAKLYQKYKPDASAVKELTADLIGEYVFNDYDFVYNLATKNQNVFQKVWGEVKYLAKVATAGSKTARQLEKVKHNFEKAWRAQKNTATESGTKYNIAALEDGKVFVQASRKVINGTTKAEQRKEISNFFSELLQDNPSIDIHTIEGDILTISKAETAHKARDDYKTVDGKPVQMTDEEFAVKLNVEAHIDEVAEVSTKIGNSAIADSKNHDFAQDGFTYRRAYFEDFDGQYYEVTLSIGHNGTVATVYNVGKTKESVPPSAKIIAVVGSKPLGGTHSNGIISQNSEKSSGSVKNSLSAEQQDYFKDSVVRDEDGNLKVMYHGTSQGGHTVFDTYGSKYGLFGAGSYFTDSKSVAESYTKKGKGDSPQVYESYLNITNPMDMDAQADPAAWQKAFPEASFPESGTNEDFYRAMEDYFEDNEYSRGEAADMAMEALEGMGYDGITHIGGGRVNADGERHQVYIAFHPEQIKDVGNQSPTSNPDIRYSLDPVEAVEPSSDKWQRTYTTEEAMSVFPNMWNVAAEESEVRNPTQIRTTVNTYRNIYNILRSEGFTGTILDASSGLGDGTRAGIEEYGFDVEDIEPYPDSGYTPKYQDYSALDKKYDVIISNAVLNVLPQDQRDALVVKMGELLNDGGRIFINVRGNDVESLAKTGKNIHLGTREWIETVKGSYQKGFTKDELKAYLEDALGSEYTVEKSNKFGGVSVVVTKNGVNAEVLDSVGLRDDVQSDSVRYSISEDSIAPLVNEAMTMKEAKQMIDRAFVLGNIREWYDDKYKNADEWLRGEGAEDVAMIIENEYTLQAAYLDKMPGLLDEEYSLVDVLDAYVAGTLTGKVKKTSERVNVADGVLVADKRFYAPQEIENAQSLYEIANQRLSDSNREEVSKARAAILLYAHNKGAAETLGITDSELNKKLRSWGGYSATARDISMRINSGVHSSNRWTGIESVSWLNKATVTNDEVARMVKSLEGDGDGYQTKYIARTMLSLDTHIDWSWLNIKFDTDKGVNSSSTSGKCNGYYLNSSRLVHVKRDAPNTVAHEMGHALDYQWGRDLGYTNTPLTEISRHTEHISGEAKVWFDSFKEFADSLVASSDIRSEYSMNVKETFARFVAKFVEWTEHISTGRSTGYESYHYNDKFTQEQFVRFARLLQEKAAIDARGLTENRFSISPEGEAPQRRSGYSVYGENIRVKDPSEFEFAPLGEELAPIPAEATQERELFPDDYAPMSEDDGAAEERLASLSESDMPPEVEAPYYEDSSPADPFEDRDIKAVGNRKVKAYMYEHPEVKPYFQEEANVMLGELEDTVKGERIYSEEGGWTGTSRYTSDDIAYLRDSLGYTYAEIERGLRNIIEDNGAENNAVSKRIEFILHDRLSHGYSDFRTGLGFPPNMKYVNLVRGNEIVDYSREAWDELVRNGERYAPVEEVGPVVETPATEATESVAEEYEAIRPSRRAAEPMDDDIAPIGENVVYGDKLVRVDTERPGEKRRKWVGTSTESEQIKGKVLPDDLDQDTIHYQPISNKTTLGNANARLNGMGYESSVQYFNSQFAGKKVTLDDIALGERLIQEAVKRGDTKTAGELIQNVAILGTELGQKVQALSIIKRLTPEGQLGMLKKVVERGKTKGDKAYEGVELTQEMIDEILKVYRNDGTYDQAKLDEAVEKVKKKIADQMKVTKMDKVNAWRYLSMLGNPKTHIRNLVSNVAMKGTVAVKNVLARTIESVAPIKNRTKTWKSASDEVKAFAQKTTAEMKDILSDGGKYSEDASIKQKRQIFKNKILNGLYEFNSDLLTKEDWWFSRSSFTSALSEYLTANGIRTEEDIKNNPKVIEKAKLYATEQSQIATFRQYSWLANKINDIESHNAATQMAVGSILPFKKTPINIAKTGLNYSPLGFAKTLTYDISQVKKGKMEASELVDHLSQNVTGSALTLVGYLLASAGLLSGGGEDDDEGEYDYQLGEQSYSVNIGGQSYSLSWLSPVAMPLFVGANAYEQLVEGKEWNGDVVVETLAQTLDPLSEMSFLSGLNQVLSSYDSGLEKFAGIGESMVQNYATQFVPTLSSQVATVLDDTKRSTKVAADSDFRFFDETINKLKLKIPGLRETLEPSTDIWGNEVKQTEDVITRAFETFLAPYARKENIATEIDAEIKSLYSQTGDTGIIPSVPYNYVNYKDEKYEMSASDFTAFKKTYGQTSYSLLEELFRTDVYQNASAEERAKMVNDVYGYARDVAKREFLASRGVEYTNAQSGGEEYYRDDPILGAIENDMTPDEYTFSATYPEKYAFFKSNGISYADYASADEDGKRAYTWAYENPGKYTVSKVISDDLMVYRQYTNDLNDLKADKDSSGKTISGSRKDKVLDYINGMDIDYGQKVILFKTEYPADDTYNGEIVDYLNSRSDISYEQMVAILKELGFKVNGNKVTWD